MDDEGELRWWNKEPDRLDAQVYRTRLVTLPTEAARVFAQSDVDHVLFAVAQYWNDNASDEVHVEVLGASPEAFRRAEGGDPATLAAVWREASPDAREYEETPWFGWHTLRYEAYPYFPGYGELIPAFEAFCGEFGHQEAELGECYRPIAHASRGAPHDVRWTDAAVRPWLDAAAPPRGGHRLSGLAEGLLARPDGLAVLADYWREQGDERGNWLASVLRGVSEPEAWGPLVDAWIAQRDDWLGELGAYVPRSGIELGPRLFEELGLYVPEGADAPEAHPIYGAVRRLRFLPGSPGFVSDALRHVEAISALTPATAALAGALDGPMQARFLEIEGADLDGLDAIDWSAWPRLQRLRIAAPGISPGVLGILDGRLPPGVALDVAPLRARARVMYGEEDVYRQAAGDFADVVEVWLGHPAAASRRVAIWQADPSSGRATGFAVDRDGEGVRARQTSLSSEADPATLDALRERFPQLRVTMWSPGGPPGVLPSTTD